MPYAYSVWIGVSNTTDWLNRQQKPSRPVEIAFVWLCWSGNGSPLQHSTHSTRKRRNNMSHCLSYTQAHKCVQVRVWVCEYRSLSALVCIVQKSVDSFRRIHSFHFISFVSCVRSSLKVRLRRDHTHTHDRAYTFAADKREAKYEFQTQHWTLNQPNIFNQPTNKPKPKHAA